MKRLALPVILLTVLSACQSRPASRDFSRTNAFSSSAGDCTVNPCASVLRCPPGTVLARVPISQGGGRICRERVSRFARVARPEQQVVESRPAVQRQVVQCQFVRSRPVVQRQVVRRQVVQPPKFRATRQVSCDRSGRRCFVSSMAF